MYWMKFASIFKGLRFPKKIESATGKSIPMRYAFTGASGHKYYHYIDAANDMNPARYIEYYLPMVKEYFLGVKRTELDTFFTKCKVYVNIKQY